MISEKKLHRHIQTTCKHFLCLTFFSWRLFRIIIFTVFIYRTLVLKSEYHVLINITTLHIFCVENIIYQIIFLEHRKKFTKFIFLNVCPPDSKTIEEITQYSCRHQPTLKYNKLHEI